MPVRYHILDNIRGFNLISMIVYHLVWDMVYLFDRNWEWYQSDMAYIWQQSICWSFILLSGFCWSLGKRQLKRGFVTFMVGAMISIITIIFMPENRIIFGILTLIGSCTLLLIPLENRLRKINRVLGVIVSMGLFILLKPINEGYIGIGAYRILTLPESLFQGDLMTYIGFTKPDFYSTDYFSVIPWFFLFVAGYFLYQIMSEKDYLEILKKQGCQPLAYIGRHSLVIYVIHQPVLYLLLQCLHQ